MDFITSDAFRGGYLFSGFLIGSYLLAEAAGWLYQHWGR
jgi:hypothetical protein